MRKLLLLTTTMFLILFCATVFAGLNSGLIVHYSFDKINGDTVIDESENNDAVLLGNAEWTADGRHDGAVHFDGIDSCVIDDAGEESINGLDAFTVSVWVKSDEIGHDRGIFMGIFPDGADNVFGLRYDKASWDVKGSENVIKASLTTTGGKQTYESSADVQTTEWQHITLTWTSGEQLMLYVDGMLDSDATHNSDATDGVVAGTDQLIIGKGAKDADGSWLGLIDDFRLYDRVLADDEISRLAGGVLSVEPTGKLATTWADQKSR